VYEVRLSSQSRDVVEQGCVGSRRRSSISLCALSFDEEDHIGRMLSYFYNCVDEILLLDGYSTDSTLEIPSDFPDPLKKMRVFAMPQKARTRNEVVSSVRLLS
jgi:hypothetical protein